MLFMNHPVTLFYFNNYEWKDFRTHTFWEIIWRHVRKSGILRWIFTRIRNRWIAWACKLEFFIPSIIFQITNFLLWTFWNFIQWSAQLKTKQIQTANWYLFANHINLLCHAKQYHIFTIQMMDAPVENGPLG